MEDVEIVDIIKDETVQ